MLSDRRNRMWCFPSVTPPPSWRESLPSGPGRPHCWGYTISLRHTAIGRTPLYEWSARRRDLYLTIHSSLTRQTSTPPAEFEPAVPASERPRTHTFEMRGQWDRPLHARSCETDSAKSTQFFAGGPKPSLSRLLVTSTLESSWLAPCISNIKYFIVQLMHSII